LKKLQQCVVCQIYNRIFAVSLSYERQAQNYEKGLINYFIYMGKLSTPNNQEMNDRKFDFIDQWLPARYTSSVNMILKEDKKDPAYIRQVKNTRTDDMKIIDALYIVAQLNKLQVED